MPRQIRHRPVIRARMTEDGRKYRCECTCSTFSRWAFERYAAVQARDHHLAGIAPAAADRCRDTAAHGTKWWDPCSLCKDQLPLPGFEDLASTP